MIATNALLTATVRTISDSCVHALVPLMRSRSAAAAAYLLDRRSPASCFSGFLHSPLVALPFARRRSPCPISRVLFAALLCLRLSGWSAAGYCLPRPVFALAHACFAPIPLLALLCLFVFAPPLSSRFFLSLLSTPGAWTPMALRGSRRCSLGLVLSLRRMERWRPVRFFCIRSASHMHPLSYPHFANYECSPQPPGKS